MAAALLPGFRHLRAPLATGAVWLLVLWLAFRPILPADPTGVLADLDALAKQFGPVGRGVAFAFVAALLGGLTEPAVSAGLAALRKFVEDKGHPRAEGRTTWQEWQEGSKWVGPQGAARKIEDKRDWVLRCLDGYGEQGRQAIERIALDRQDELLALGKLLYGVPKMSGLIRVTWEGEWGRGAFGPHEVVLVLALDGAGAGESADHHVDSYGSIAAEFMSDCPQLLYLCRRLHETASRRKYEHPLIALYATVRETLTETLPLTRVALLTADAQLMANEVDREQEEANLRLGIALPVLAVAVVLGARGEFWPWTVVALALWIVLIADGHRRNKRAGDLLLTAIQAQRAQPPDWTRVAEELKRVRERISEVTQPVAVSSIAASTHTRDPA